MTEEKVPYETDPIAIVAKALADIQNVAESKMQGTDGYSTIYVIASAALLNLELLKANA